MPDDAEWRALFLTEVRLLRGEMNSLKDALMNFKVEVATDQGERRGRSTVITAVISFVVSFGVAVLHGLFHK